MSWPADLFNGFVAAGTLALAAVTVKLARATNKMVAEASHARMDALAPKVAVLDLQVLNKPVQPALDAHAAPGEIDIGTTWDLTQHGEVRIGVMAEGTLVNEGSTTALVALNPGRDVEVLEVSAPDNAGSLRPVAQQGDRYVVRPRVTVRVTFILWRAARDWAQDPSALGEVGLEITGSAKSVIDTCQLTFGKHVLIRHRAKDGWAIADNDMTTVVPNPPPKPVAAIGEVARRYL